MKKALPIMFLILCIGLSKETIGQGFIIRINHTVLPYGNKYEYLVNDSSIIVSCKGDHCKLATKTVAISTDQKTEILKRINDADFKELKSGNKPLMIDGNSWEFSAGGKTVTLYHYLEEMDLILEYINSILPSEIRWISLDNAPRVNE